MLNSEVLEGKQAYLIVFLETRWVFLHSDARSLIDGRSQMMSIVSDFCLNNMPGRDEVRVWNDADC